MLSDMIAEMAMQETMGQEAAELEAMENMMQNEIDLWKPKKQIKT